MVRFSSATVVLLGTWISLGHSRVASPQSPSTGSAVQLARWPSESVELIDGRRLSGLVESEDETWLRLIEIHRPPGRPMYLTIRSIDRASVAKVVRIDPRQRAELQQRIDQFRNRSLIEEGRWQAIRLSPVADEGTNYQRYHGKWFTLDSTAGEEITRRAIVRIEQVFTAYRQVLPPRNQPGRPLRLVVLGSMQQYQAHLKRLQINIHSPACFIREDNLVVAGSELNRLAAQLDKISARHEQLRDELTRLEKQMSDRLATLGQRLRQEGVSRNDSRKLLRLEKAKFQKQIDGKNKELDSCDRENRRMFDGLTHRMFARLYHEAFHAYLENYVYPHGDSRSGHRVPRWLNEGLAVMFEGGLLESGTLRIDAPNREVLQRLKADLDGSRPLALEELLSADPKDFLLHGGASRRYDHCWGLAYYLTFEKGLLGSPALERYVAIAAKDTPPNERFEQLVGMPLVAFQTIWRQYISELK